MWTASSKFIRSQCNKARIVDTLLFGTFARADAIDQAASADYFVYCPGPKALFKLGENKQNLSDIPQATLDAKLIQLNVSSVAQVCGASTEAVQSIMSAIRDEVVESVFQRKANVSLNFGVGSLSLLRNGTSQFKSAAASGEAATETRDEADRVKECPEFDRKSRLTEEGLRALQGPSRVQSASQASEREKQSIAERSLHYMQQRQQHEGVARNPASHQGADSRFVKPVAPTSTKVQDSPYFDRRNKRTQSGRQASAEPGAANTASYEALNGFLRNQIEMTSKASEKKSATRAATKNNAVIEAAAQLKQNGQQEQVLDYVRSASAHAPPHRTAKNVGLSRMKITAKIHAAEKSKASEFDLSSEAAAKNAFLHKNRELHTNSVFKSGHNATHNPADAQFSPHYHAQVS